jgi:hypothetical protein
MQQPNSSERPQTTPTSDGGRSLRSLSHEEAKDLLKFLGVFSLPDHSVFIQCKIKGSDLEEVRTAEDLEDCGILAPKIRLRSIAATLAQYREKGVPAIPPSPPATSTSAGSSSAANPATGKGSTSADKKTSTATTASANTADNKNKSTTIEVNGKNSGTTVKEGASPKSPVPSQTADNNSKSNETDKNNGTSTTNLDNNSSSKVKKQMVTNNNKLSSNPVEGSLIGKLDSEGVTIIVPTANSNKFTKKRKEIDCHRLDDPLFKNLFTFQANEGTTLRPTLWSDFYGPNATQCVDHDGNWFIPQAFQQQLYGYITTKRHIEGKPNKKGSVGGGELPSSPKTPRLIMFSPYGLLHKTLPIPDSCGIVAIPNFLSNDDCCLPCTQEDYVNALTPAVKVTARLRLLVKEAASLQFCRVSSTSVLFGQALPRDKLHPEIIKSTTGTMDDIIPSNKYKFHRSMYFLWHVPTRSLMSVREGLLVLVPFASKDGSIDTGRITLGIVYFNSHVKVEDMKEQIEMTRRRCKQRLYECHYDAYDFKTTELYPMTRIVKYSFGLPTEMNQTTTATTGAAEASGAGQEGHRQALNSSTTVGLMTAAGTTGSTTASNGFSLDLVGGGNSGTDSILSQGFLSSFPPLELAPYDLNADPYGVSNMTFDADETMTGSNMNSMLFSASDPLSLESSNRNASSMILTGLFDQDFKKPIEDTTPPGALSSPLDWARMSISAEPFTPASMKAATATIDTTTASSVAPPSWSSVARSKSEIRPSHTVNGGQDVRVTDELQDHHDQQGHASVILGTCPFELNCKYGKTCRNGPHSEETERVFHCFNSMAERNQYKFFLCTRRETHDIRSCPYYHEHDKTQQERKKMFCIACLIPGHLMETCRNVSQEEM